MPALRALQPFVHDDPADFEELAASCGSFIDAWLNDGGEPTDDEVVGIYGLWSQSVDAKGSDEDGFYQWAYPFFVRYRNELRSLLEHS